MREITHNPFILYFYTLFKRVDAILPQFLAKFCVIGVINTIIGYGTTFALLYLGHINYLISNSCGYLVGLVSSYLLNKHLNFRSDNPVTSEFPKFLLTFLVAYACNNAALITFVEVLHISKFVSILVAGGVYTGFFYLLSRFFVFRELKVKTQV